jgi:hypothetical protein
VDEVFGLQVFIAPRPILVDNSPVDQDGVKIAVEINYYNYSGASSDPNAKIALAVLVGAAEASSFRNGTVANVDIPSNNPTYQGYQHWDFGFQLANRDGSGARSGSIQSSWEVQFSNISQIQGQFQAGWVVSAAYFSFGVNETRPGHSKCFSLNEFFHFISLEFFNEQKTKIQFFLKHVSLVGSWNGCRGELRPNKCCSTAHSYCFHSFVLFRHDSHQQIQRFLMM